VVVAAPIVLLIGVPAVGYVIGVAAWVLLRLFGVAVDRRAGTITHVSEQAALRLSYRLVRVAELAGATLVALKPPLASPSTNNERTPCWQRAGARLPLRFTGQPKRQCAAESSVGDTAEVLVGAFLAVIGAAAAYARLRRSRPADRRWAASRGAVRRAAEPSSATAG